MKTKLAIVIPSLNGGGAERVMLNIVKYLDRNQFEINLIVINKEGAYSKEIPDDINIIDLKSNRLRYATFKLIKELNLLKPEVILSTLGHLNLLILGLRRFLVNKPRIIIREANTPSKIFENFSTLKRCALIYLYTKVYSSADIIIAQCKEMREDIVNMFQIDEKKVIYIYNPVDIRFIIDKANTFNPYDTSQINIVSVGRLTYQKGFDILIKAFKEVASYLPNSKLTIIGDGELKEELNQLVKKLNLSESVEIVGFKLNPYPYYKYADLFVLSSRWEGFPNVLLEALACCTRVVATDCKCGPREIIGDNEYGYLAKTNNVSDLAAKIIIGIERDKKSFDRAKYFNVENIVPIYEKILKNY